MLCRLFIPLDTFDHLLLHTRKSLSALQYRLFVLYIPTTFDYIVQPDKGINWLFYRSLLVFKNISCLIIRKNCLDKDRFLVFIHLWCKFSHLLNILFLLGTCISLEFILRLSLAYITFPLSYNRGKYTVRLTRHR